jgi:hypothetical protein
VRKKREQKIEKWELITDPFDDDFYADFTVEVEAHIDFLFIFAIQIMLSKGGAGKTPEETQDYVENNLDKVLATLWEDYRLRGILEREKKHIIDILLRDDGLGMTIMLNHKDDDFVADYWLSKKEQSDDYDQWKQSVYESKEILNELLMMALRRSRVTHYSFYHLKEGG